MLNQADVDQDYLKQAQIASRIRIRDQNTSDSIDSWYTLGLAYAVQKQAKNAENVFIEIANLKDEKNPYTWMALGIVQAYQFHFGNAYNSFSQSWLLGEHSETVKILRKVTGALSGKFQVLKEE